jgi:16S rRNA (guanine527-N7)-methyltransferase
MRTDRSVASFLIYHLSSFSYHLFQGMPYGGSRTSVTENDKGQFEQTLRSESAAYEVQLGDAAIGQLGQYYELIQKWNPRLHLVAPCPTEEFATRHVLESLTALRFLSEGARVADVGSGGGLPIIPCLIAQPSLSAILIEASPKKAVFLREAVSQLALKGDVVIERFEDIASPQVQFVTCRALEKFAESLPTMLDWAPPSAGLLLFGGEAISNRLNEMDRKFRAITMPNSTGRYLFVVASQSDS